MSENERSPSAAPVTAEHWHTLLEEGEIEVEGQMPWSSNATLLVTVASSESSARAIYKPAAGERPLWDFPEGVYRYEAAAYELSRAFDLDVVPETIIRKDAPYGEGSLQRFIEADFEEHYFSLIEEERFGIALRLIAGFDLLTNNADRKGGHLIVDGQGHIYGIDNSLSFHPAPKLRTVMWDFAGEEIPERIMEVAKALSTDLPEALFELLSLEERLALNERAQALVRSGQFPEPDLAGRPFPWPRI